jgi:hypothetical protein
MHGHPPSDKQREKNKTDSRATRITFVALDFDQFLRLLINFCETRNVFLSLRIFCVKFRPATPLFSLWTRLGHWVRLELVVTGVVPNTKFCFTHTEKNKNGTKTVGEREKWNKKLKAGSYEKGDWKKLLWWWHIQKMPAYTTNRL